MRQKALLTAIAALIIIGCAPVQSGASRPETAPGTQASADRLLVMFIRVEPATLANRAFVQKSAGLFVPWRLFNALPALFAARGDPLPELLASLPALNTDTWQVFPDGTMQTTYTLRPNLTWHDGQPFTADDMVFAWRVYSYPDLGLSGQTPMSAISEVTASDRDHFVIRWKELFPDANTLSALDHELAPLPKHVLGANFDQIETLGKDAFINHPFWSPQYVGLGPYKLQRREAGSVMDLARFEGYALGVPKIARIQLRFSDDPNVVVSHMLAGEAHVATDSSISEEGATTLAREWSRTGAGSVFFLPSSWRYLGFQLRPEIANPRAILDVRVRKAMAHVIDRHTVSDGAYAGQAIVSDTPVWTNSAWGDALDGLSTYPLDLRASESLMNQAGFSKGSDGVYRGPDGRLSMEITTTESASSTAEIAIVANQLQTAGFDIQQQMIPRTLAQDSQARAVFPALQNISTLMGEPGLETLNSGQIPTERNRWVGGNRGGWSSPEYDRQIDTFHHTLARPERLAALRQMLRIYLEDMPRVSYYFPAGPFVHVAALQGPATAAPESRVAWNVHEWEFK